MIGPQLPPDKYTPPENHGVQSSPIYTVPSTNVGYLPPFPVSDGYLPPPVPPQASITPPPSASPSKGYLPPTSPQAPAPSLHLAEVTARPPMQPYQYDPTPGPRMRDAVSSIQPLASEPIHTPQHLTPFLRSPRTLTPLALSLFQKLNSTRTKRSVVFSEQESDTSEGQLRVIVKQILDRVLENNQELNKVKATIRDSRSINPVSFDLQVPKSNHLGGPVVDKHHHDPHHHPYQPLPPYLKKPIITTHELPAPEGCRSFATKECHKIPIVVPRKVINNKYCIDFTLPCHAGLIRGV